MFSRRCLIVSAIVSLSTVSAFSQSRNVGFQELPLDGAKTLKILVMKEAFICVDGRTGLKLVKQGAADVVTGSGRATATVSASGLVLDDRVVVCPAIPADALKKEIEDEKDEFKKKELAKRQAVLSGHQCEQVAEADFGCVASPVFPVAQLGFDGFDGSSSLTVRLENGQWTERPVNVVASSRALGAGAREYSTQKNAAFEHEFSMTSSVPELDSPVREGDKVDVRIQEPITGLATATTRLTIGPAFLRDAEALKGTKSMKIRFAKPSSSTASPVDVLVVVDGYTNRKLSDDDLAAGEAVIPLFRAITDDALRVTLDVRDRTSSQLRRRERIAVRIAKPDVVFQRPITEGSTTIEGSVTEGVKNVLVKRCERPKDCEAKATLDVDAKYSETTIAVDGKGFKREGLRPLAEWEYVAACALAESGNPRDTVSCSDAVKVEPVEIDLGSVTASFSSGLLLAQKDPSASGVLDASSAFASLVINNSWSLLGQDDDGCATAGCRWRTIETSVEARLTKAAAAAAAAGGTEVTSHYALKAEGVVVVPLNRQSRAQRSLWVGALGKFGGNAIADGYPISFNVEKGADGKNSIVPSQRASVAPHWAFGLRLGFSENRGEGRTRKLISWVDVALGGFDNYRDGSSDPSISTVKSAPYPVKRTRRLEIGGRFKVPKTPLEIGFNGNLRMSSIQNGSNLAPSDYRVFVALRVDPVKAISGVFGIPK